MAPSDVYGMDRTNNSLEKVSVVCVPVNGIPLPSKHVARKRQGNANVAEWALCFGRSRSHHGVRIVTNRLRNQRLDSH